jgi:hypothetical protein
VHKRCRTRSRAAARNGTSTAPAPGGQRRSRRRTAGVEAFGEPHREALETFRGMNNFENHPLPVLEDAIARGWADAEGAGEARLVDAVWHGLSRPDRV